jgi:divalent metal cation (Fe/Co/Zn/Cd) transporter
VKGRDRDLRAAIGWCASSLGWAALVGVASLAAGLAGGVVALVAFGVDSLTDGVASGVLVWRFASERKGRGGRLEIEAEAARVVGGVLLLLGCGVAVDAVITLAQRSRPDDSTLGIAVTAASLVVLPCLATAKLRLAGSLGSAGLRGDGMLSLAGALLAAVALVSLALDRGLGWWWADGAAALLIAAFMMREGVRTVNTARQRRV